MKQDKFYLAVQENHDGKRIAFVAELTESENIFKALATYKSAEFGSVFSTRKRAKEAADYWNECSKRNGVYLYA